MGLAETSQRMVSSKLKFWIPAAALLAATATAGETDPLFASFETIEITLEAPLRKLMRERDEDEEFAGKLKYLDADGDAIELDIKLRTRGKFRASKENCEFAPLRLNFRTSQAAGTVFENQDKLKLVTHCDTRSIRYEQGLITEYLTYRLLNALTEYSYRVRLLRIRYVYSDSKSRIDSFAFLIENDERLAARIDQDLLAVPKLKVENLEREYTNLVSVYQFMIGNTDFSPVAGAKDDDCCHNFTPFSAGASGVYSVPYDFDQCGLVDVPHASPNPRFRSVWQRLYRGRCTNNDLLPDTLELFRSKRPILEAMVTEQAELSTNQRRKNLSYLRSFYKVIDSPSQLEKRLIKKCI